MNKCCLCNDIGKQKALLLRFDLTETFCISHYVDVLEFLIDDMDEDVISSAVWKCKNELTPHIARQQNERIREQNRNSMIAKKERKKL